MRYGVDQSRVHDIEELKHHVLHVWHGMGQSVTDKAIEEWRGRLRAFVRAKVDTLNDCGDIIRPILGINVSYSV